MWSHVQQVGNKWEGRSGRYANSEGVEFKIATAAANGVLLGMHFNASRVHEIRFALPPTMRGKQKGIGPAAAAAAMLNGLGE